MDRRNLLLFVIGGLIVALGLAFLVSPYASSLPDGLEKVSIDKGFADTAKAHALGGGPLADYGVKGVENEKLSTGLSGVIGVVITFGVAMILFGALRVYRARRKPAPAGGT